MPLRGALCVGLPDDGAVAVRGAAPVGPQRAEVRHGEPVGDPPDRHGGVAFGHDAEGVEVRRGAAGGHGGGVGRRREGSTLCPEAWGVDV